VAARAHAALQKPAGQRPEFMSLNEQMRPRKNRSSTSAVEPINGIAAKTVTDKMARRRGAMARTPTQSAEFFENGSG
jgi:hypothetical protein